MDFRDFWKMREKEKKQTKAPHHVKKMWPRNHNEWVLKDDNPIIVCACGWKYERFPEKEVGNFTGVDAVNELLDKYNAHLNAVKNKWGNYDV